MAPPSSKIAEGKLSVKYESFPLNYNTSLIVLDTDYDNYAVIWSCSSIGAVGHTESAWVSREVDCKKFRVHLNIFSTLTAHVKRENSSR